MGQAARKEAVSAAFAKRGGKIRRETPANGKAFTDEEINELLNTKDYAVALPENSDIVVCYDRDASKDEFNKTASLFADMPIYGDALLCKVYYTQRWLDLGNK